MPPVDDKPNDEPLSDDITSPEEQAGLESAEAELEAAGGEIEEGSLADAIGKGLRGDDAPGDDEPPAPAADGEKPDEPSDSGSPADKKPPKADLPDGEPGKDAADGEKPDETKDETPDDEKVPEGLSEPAEARFKKLISDRKELRTENESLRQNNASFSEFVRSFSAEPHELDRLSRFSRALKSGTVEGMQYALQEIQQYGQAIAQQLGVPFHGFDPLAQRPDLKERVDRMELSREDAERIASMEAQGTLREQHTRAAQQSAQAQEAFTMEVRNVQQAADSMEAQLSLDPRWDEPLFQAPGGELTSMKQMVYGETRRLIGLAQRGGLDLRAIPQMISNYATSLRAALPPQAGPAAPPRREPAPLRGGRSATPAPGAPTSMAEAIARDLGVSGTP